VKITFIDSVHGFASGARYGAGVILETTDGGLTWSQHAFPATLSFGDIYFPDLATGYAVGLDTSVFYRSVIYKTTSAGSNWVPVAVTPDRVFLEGVRFAGNSVTGIVYGNSWSGDTLETVPFIGRTVDGGASWSYTVLSDFPQRSVLVGGKLITDSIGYICGGSQPGVQPIMLHTTNGGMTFVYHQPNGEVKEYNLDQNYPNPFNPTTTINYTLGKGVKVTLKVYDVLGREVETLVNDVQQPGTYRVQWDASDVTSGVYFYCLSAAHVVAVRKMIVLH
jgi:hypothetical protein